MKNTTFPAVGSKQWLKELSKAIQNPNFRIKASTLPLERSRSMIGKHGRIEHVYLSDKDWTDMQTARAFVEAYSSKN